MARHTGLLPFAEPTARGCVPSCRASSPYVRVSPGGIARKAAQTRRWNGVPSGSTATPSNARTSPAKYARTWSLIGVGARVPSNGSPKRRAWRALPRSSRWIGPIGVSTVSTRSMFTPSGKPDGGGGIRPPRPPGLRALEQRARCPSEGTAKAEIGSGECVGFTERAERHELRGPVADAGDFAERRRDRVEVLRSIQPDASVAGAPGELNDGVCPHRGHAPQLRFGEPGRSRETSELLDQLDRHRSRALHRDLLTEDRAHGQLERIPRARDSQSGPEERLQCGVESEVLEDRSGVGAQIEHALETSGDLECPGRQRRRHARLQMRRSTATHFQPAFGQPAAQVAIGDAQPLGETRRITRLLEQAESARERGRGAGLGGRAGGRVWAAAEAGAVAGGLGSGSGRKEDDVFAPRQSGRAAWTAIDVRRPHAEEEPAGEASIATLDRAVAGFGIHGGNE